MVYKTGTTNDSVATTALEIDGPQPVWMTLNQARERAFTGEIVFETEPEVAAYLDHGVVYYAERTADSPLGQRLLDAGVVGVTQLERGVVRIGDREHLGRLFDRDSSIDRHAVIVTVEVFTGELIAELANRAVADVRVTAYRHHPSGVHRWFVAPTDRVVVPRPLSAVGQLDGTVVDDLPSLLYGFEEDELIIEWDVEAGTDTDTDTEPEPDTQPGTDGADDTSDWTAEIDDQPSESSDETNTEFSDFELAHLDLVGVAPLELELLEPESFELELSGSKVAASETSVETTGGCEDFEDFEFSVVWPDGSEEPTDLSTLDLGQSIETETIFIESGDGELQFSMPPLMLSDEPEAADADVPDDVADAVRRAIAAIESAGVDEFPESDDAIWETSDVEITEEFTAMDFEFADLADAAAVERSGLSGFAPPTMATRAEVLYAQMSDDAAIADEAEQAPGATGDDDGASGERASSLRRLIGSLRRRES